ncbi:MAG: type II toxin-antitoxin system RelE/ParE family toxin [Candidatus Latescibacterota bacterium]
MPHTGPGKALRFVGSSRADLRAFPEPARRSAGYELRQVQADLDPDDWRPMPSVGPGVREIRVHEGGEFRVLYVAHWADAIYVLHALHKKAVQTPQRDLDVARARLRQIRGEHP